MTDFTFSMRFQAEAAAARAEVARIKTELAAIGDAGRKGAAGAADLKKEVDGVGKAGGNAIPALPGQLTQTGQAAQGAAGSVGNLVAQFNDIGMMMAAGQNPLQLAIQQGTQITQVIGPMGAGGALKALGSAFMGMLSPINLVTIGAIAAGGALVQWLTAAKDEAVSLDDALAASADQIDAFRQASDKASLPWAKLREEFGSADPALRAALQDLAAIEKLKAFDTLDQTAQSMAALVTATSWWDDSSGNTLAQGFLGFVRNSEAARAEADRFLESLGKLNAADPSVKLQAALDLKAQLEATTGGFANMNGEQRQLYEGLTRIVVQLQTMGIEAAGVADAYEGITDAQARAYEAMAQSRAESDAALVNAEEMLAKLVEQAELNELIRIHGEDSREVAEARVAAEREAAAALVESMEISDELKTQLMDAWDAANGIAAADMASGISAAGGAASTLAQNLGISYETARRLAALGPQGMGERGQQGAGGGRGSDPRLFGGSALDIQTYEAQRFLDAWKPPRPSRGGGGGRASVDRNSLAALQDQAERAMEAMELAIAAINEKVAAGLLSTSDGVEAVTRARTQAANAIADLIPKMEKANETSGPKAVAAVESWRASLKGLVADIGEVGESLSETLADGFKDSFAAFLKGTEDGKDAFGSFADFVEDKIADLLAERFTTNLIEPLFDSLLGGLAGGLKLGAGAGAIIPQSMAQAPVKVAAASGFGAGNATPAAPAQKSKQDVVVNVVNKAPGAEARTMERDEGGTRIIEVIVDRVRGAIAGDIARGSGPIPGALSEAYGVSRSPR